MTALTDLPSIVRYIQTNAARLDPESRYVRDVLQLAAGSADAGDFERRLDAGCRGLRHSGPDVFVRMSLEEKILANLITPETTLFRFGEGELEAIDHHLLPHLANRRARILIVPCSHGEEAFTIAAYFLKVSIDFELHAFDIQPALIREARTGRLTFGYPTEYLAAPGYVSRTVLDRIRFEVGDAFALPEEAKGFDLVLCRNFVGYFLEEVAVDLVDRLLGRVAPNGVLFLDGFCVGKLPGIERRLEARGAKRLFTRPAWVAA